MGFYTALLFLTRIPLSQIKLDEKKIASSIPFFPLAGTVVGGILCLIYFLGEKILPQQVLSVAIVAVWIMVTGGMHMDGFADTLDGLFCGQDRDKKLTVMKDSRIGAYGTMGTVVLLLFKASLINSLSRHFVMPALLLAPTLSRWVMSYAIINFPYVREKGLGKAFSLHKSFSQFLLSSLMTFIISFLISKAWGLIIAMIALTIGFVLIKYIISQLDGLTGDTYGAINEVCEAAVLLVFTILSYKG